MIFHIFGLPYAISNLKFSACPFTQNSLALCDMLMSHNHDVIYYGSETSNPNCTEFVEVLRLDEIKESYGDNFLNSNELFNTDIDTYAAQMFNVRCVHELKKRANTDDFVCVMWGIGHQKICNELTDLPIHIVEPAFGYETCFSRFRVFPSNSWRSFHYGLFHAEWEKMEDEDKLDESKYTTIASPYWFPKHWDTVIPHHINTDQFTYEVDKEDFLLHISRVVPNKGIEMSVRVAQHLNKKLVIAGQGNFEKTMGFKPPSNVELVGKVDLKEREKLMSKALAVMGWSLYPEPFGKFVLEAGASGTPVITSDIGAFHENVKHGYSGYSVSSFQQAINAVNNIDKIKPENCRKWVEDNYNFDLIAKMYNAYFTRLEGYIKANREGKGLYYLDDNIAVDTSEFSY